jgi:hypothetical protein
MYNFVYYFGAWSLAFTFARAVLAVVDLIETGGKKK